MFTKYRTRVALSIILAAASLAPAVARAQVGQGSLPEGPGGGVVDPRRTLGPDARGRIEAAVANVAASHGVRLAVAVVPDTGARTIEDYSLALFRAWRLGEDSGGRGVLLVVAVDTRKNYLEVGSAMFDALPEAERTRILVDVFRATARASDLETAVEATVDALRERITQPLAAPAAPTFQSPPVPTTGATSASSVIPTLPSDDGAPWPLYVFGGLVAVGGALLVFNRRGRGATPRGGAVARGSSPIHGSAPFTSSHSHGSSYDASSVAAGAMMAASSDCASSGCASSDCAGSGSSW
jgi:uncharacterized membrane protein YgcG